MIFERPRQNRPRQISYQGKRLQVWGLLFKNRSPYLLTDYRGRLYHTFWLEPCQRHYRHYDNIFDFQRSLIQSLQKGQNNLLRLQDIQDQLLGVQAELSILQKTDQERQKRITEQISQIIDGFHGVKDKALQEAVEHLEFVLFFQDSRGRFNVGVLSCHNSTAYYRLAETFEHIQIWHLDYAQRLLAVNRLIDEFFTAVVRFESALKKDLQNLNKTSLTLPEQIEFLIQRQITYQEYFEKWLYLRPFNAWVKNVKNDLKDLRRLLEAIKGRQPTSHQVDKLKKLLAKLQESAKLKKYQRDIADLINLLTDVELQAIPKQELYLYSPPAFNPELLKQINQIKSGISQVDDSSFQRPIVQSLVISLEEISRQLKEGFVQELTPRDQLKELLKKL